MHPIGGHSQRFINFLKSLRTTHISISPKKQVRKSVERLNKDSLKRQDSNDVQRNNANRKQSSTDQSISEYKPTDAAQDEW
jgi:hypothetical protein